MRGIILNEYGEPTENWDYPDVTDLSSDDVIDPCLQECQYLVQEGKIPFFSCRLHIGVLYILHQRLDAGKYPVEIGKPLRWRHSFYEPFDFAFVLLAEHAPVFFLLPEIHTIRDDHLKRRPKIFDLHGIDIRKQYAYMGGI